MDDVVVIGGGAAGLSAALALGRALRRVVVVDEGEPRNASARHLHNYLTRDGTPPAELLRLGREEVAGYGVQLRSAAVTQVSCTQEGFSVSLSDATQVHARRVLLATGLVDVLPDVPGLADRWGRDVLHCPYCHGYEVRGQAVGVLSTSPFGVHAALLWRGWTQDVTLFTHTGPAPSAEQHTQLAARGVTVVDGEVTGLVVENDALAGVRVGDRVVPRRALVVAGRLEARAELADALGLPVVEATMGEVVVGTRLAADPTGRTEVPGVWVAGNVTDPLAQVIGAAAQGLATGAAINADLLAEETAAAVRHQHAGTAQRHAMPDTAAKSAAQFWDELYGQRNQVWSSNPNPVLAEVVAPLSPGVALDLGCGEGADALWLAGRGWQVLAVDVSQTALDRVQARGDARVRTERHDLTETFPAGAYDLVSAQFLQSPLHLPREVVLRRAARAVAPGGLLLVVEHGAPPSWGWQSDAVYPTPQQVLDLLDLGSSWTVERLGRPERAATGPDGQAGTLIDTVVAVRRPRH